MKPIHRKDPVPNSEKKKIHLLLWPFVALWSLLSFILRLTGRLVAGILGLALMIVGIILTVLIISAPVGIPLIVLGFLLMIRSFF
ncbi:MAG TPA: hypothetical protein VM123_04660 [archaeon]|nr:hypothetical protein [archaeon]